ncbi:MAG: hypothetical protein SF339_26385 [Blastocatellia bacterium]|nr:hypothetical protein [Blastocatellia bacterium]
MKMLSTAFFALTLTVCLTGLLAAQTPAPTPGKRTPVVHAKQARQQKRIAEGVNSGELKAGEVRKLEKQQQEIQQEKREARADGTVTGAERKEIRKDQKESSRQIYRAKHNNKTRK